MLQGAIVNVTSTEEVSKTVTFARSHHIEFVVKAGGHSTSSESATRGGIVISLCKMRNVSVDTESRTVRVQGGAIWDDVNTATAPHGLAVVGATASQTGVGGSTLGGGYGWLTGQHGLIVDNLISATIVLADGRILEASQDTHPDLFWAIRGAGQAFGVVTEMVFKAYDMRRDIFGGLLYFTPDKLDKVVEFANWFDEQQNERSGLFFGFRAPSPVEEALVMTLVFYDGPKGEATAFFAPLLSLHSTLGAAGMTSYTQLNRLGNIEPIPAGRKAMGGTNITFPLDKKLAHELWSAFDQIMAAYPEAVASVLAFELLPYSKVISVPVTATACANRGRFYNVGLLLCWQSPERDAAMDQYRRAIIAKIQYSQHQFNRGEHAVSYPNYSGKFGTLITAYHLLVPGHDFSSGSLFGTNLPRLQELKRTYDQNNFFRKWHNLLKPY